MKDLDKQKTIPKISQTNLLTRRNWLKLAIFGGVGFYLPFSVKQLGNQTSVAKAQIPPSGSTKTPQLSTFGFTTVKVNERGEVINRTQLKADFFSENLGNNISLEMVLIPAGSFMMGSPETEIGRHPGDIQHWVNIKPFYLGKYAVTQTQWQALMGNNPSGFPGKNRPVEQVSWYDAMAFCQKLSDLTGRYYRLPSESQWEYACRAGTTTPFYFGETITPELVNYDGNKPYGKAPAGKNRGVTTDVGSFPPNAFGLYDMHGNVFEWCQDVYHSSYNGAPTDGSAWETGGETGWRMLRGGYWGYYGWGCRSAYRVRSLPDNWENRSHGFRLALSL